MLYFGDAELVEKHLHEDLNKIIKFVKIREQQHLELLEYNKAIGVKKRSIESLMFINDQITTHNVFLTKISFMSEEIKSSEEQIIEKYKDGCVKFQAVIKLMSRVVTRILETNQQFMEKIKNYDDGLYLHEQFIKMKSTLTKLINQKEGMDLSLISKTIIEYVRHKNVMEIQKLKRLIKSLQDGDLEKIPYIYKAFRPTIEQRNVETLARMQQPKSQKSKMIERRFSPKKEQKPSASVLLSNLKNEIKQQQLLKKQKKQLATKLATMYSTLDISKRDFIEDMLTSNNIKQYDRIYGQMLVRNKFNQEQILEFQAKKDQFEERVRRFKEVMMEESQRIQEVLMIKKPVKIEKRAESQVILTEKSQEQTINTNNHQPSMEHITSTQSPNRPVPRQFILRQKQVSPRFHKQTDYTQLRITQQGFNHIKFDATNQEIFLRTNRNRLPLIGSGGSVGGGLTSTNSNSNIHPNNIINSNNTTPNNHASKSSFSIDNHFPSHFQQRYNSNLSKAKQEKQTNRKNFLMKNIELGVQNVIKQNQQRNMSENKSIAEKLKEIKPSLNNTASIPINLMEFTFYGAKKKNFALGECKNSFVF